MYHITREDGKETICMMYNFGDQEGGCRQHSWMQNGQSCATPPSISPISGSSAQDRWDKEVSCPCLLEVVSMEGMASRLEVKSEQPLPVGRAPTLG